MSGRGRDGAGGGAAAIELAPGAENNAFAQMLADLLRQNLDSKPHKKKDFARLAAGRGKSIAIVADDADVALTLEFKDGRLRVHDGIKGVPDVAVRGSSDAIMTMSNIPLTRPLGLPIPTDRGSLDVLRQMARASATGEVQIHGIIGNVGTLSRLTRVMSVNG